MPHAYANLAFTPAVRDMQSRMGSRENYAPFDDVDAQNDRLGAREAAFIAARDSFYQATVSETGWPYVQFRGGPAGFLKVLDSRTLGYADFRGNMQYISVGNLANNDCVSLILMDYPNRARLKILGRVRIVGLDEEPEMIVKLESADYRARVQRGVIITVEAFDWNCPQHITPRFTEAEIAGASQPAMPAVLGNGPLALTISGMRQLTPRVRGYELRAADGALLPPVTPGAHIDVPVRLAAGGGTNMRDGTRRYSITSAAPGGLCYEIAVQKDEAGQGGSLAAHRDYQLGTTLRCGLPGNDFALHADHRPVVLIAGGIGITPIHSMAIALARDGRNVSLHFAARSMADAAFSQPLRSALGDSMRLYLADAGERLDVRSVVANAAPDSVFYVCGPGPLIESVRMAGIDLGISPEHIRFERFAAAIRSDNKPVRVTLRRSGKVIDVSASRTILDAVQAAGIDAPAACRAGTCGTCAVKVVEGSPDHRDQALTAAERDRAALMCICVSRAHSDGLTLDL